MTGRSRVALTVSEAELDEMICELRGQRVMLDSDLARVYGVTTKRLNEQFRRNRSRFPSDFAFQLTEKEVAALRSQIATTSSQHTDARGSTRKWSQIATSSQKHRAPRLRPWAFTEHGALQAANILNSKRAVQMSVFVIRAFVKMRETFLSSRELANKLQELEKQLAGRLDTHEAAIVHVLRQIMKIINPPRVRVRPKPQIGFQH